MTMKERGRPKIKDKMKLLQTYLSKSEYDYIDELAKEYNLGKSTVVREIVKEHKRNGK